MKHRHNIYVEDDLWERIVAIARKEKRSAASYIGVNIEFCVNRDEATNEALGPRKRGE